MSKPLVRPAKLDDIDDLAELNAEVQALHVANRPDQFKPTQADQLRERFTLLLADAAARVWVAELDHEVVGYAGAVIHARPEGSLPQLRVLPRSVRFELANAAWSSMRDV